jgi:transcriptional regulator with XRE-family HTH domain
MLTLIERGVFMGFSAVLKKLRNERRISQKSLSQYLGLTRQAIASYETGKREPGYEILIKIAEYFQVSTDYLLGRTNCKEINAITVGRNIDLIRGVNTYNELSKSICAKTGALIFPEMLELYASAERMPFVGVLNILAKYSDVRRDFFYVPNTLESLKRERQLNALETQQKKFSQDLGDIAKYT